MKKNIAYLLLAFGALLFWNNALHAQFDESIQEISDENPVVIELFTSQSCSSCPPADENLRKLSENPNAITLSFHVTYWNHLHWQDTLSRQFSTDRQRQYSRQAGSKRVYTPQMIVNGATQFVGSDKQELNKAIRNARAIKKLKITRDRNVLNIHLPIIQNFKGASQIWLFGTKNNHLQNIPSGENKGRSVDYADAVLYQKSLGRWNGMDKVLSAPIPKIDEINTITILVQHNDYGPILAAGRINL